DGKIRGIAPASLRALMEHAWPGNVRELKNVVESAAMLSDGDMLGGASFEETLAAATAHPKPEHSADRRDEIRVRVGTRIEDMERALIAATVAQAPSRADAARQLGIGARTLYTKLRRYGLG